MVFQTNRDVAELVQAFEAGTLPRDRWTHAAHLTVAIWYLQGHPDGEAGAAMRDGIQRYNAAIGIPNTPNGGYHETITLFWLQVLASELRTAQGALWQITNQLVQRYADPQWLFQYYTPDRLFSPTARSTWLAPDLKSDFKPAISPRSYPS